MPTVNRETYLHLIIDRSDAHGWDGDLVAALRDLKTKFPSVHRARITFANYDIFDAVPALTEIDDLIAHLPKPVSRPLPQRGGLALDLALAHGLRQHRDLDLDSSPSAGPERPPPRPIFVVLSQNAPSRSLELELTGKWAEGLDPFELYEWSDNHPLVTLRAPQVSPTPLVRLGTSVRSLSPDGGVHFASGSSNDVLTYWSSEDAKWRALNGVKSGAPSKEWSQAVALHFEQENYARSPGDAKSDLKTLVAASRAQGILIPNTSYIVVENSAQWKMLQLSESKKLGQNAALEFLETPAPPALSIVLGYGVWMGIRHLRKRRRGARQPR